MFYSVKSFLKIQFKNDDFFFFLTDDTCEHILDPKLQNLFHKTILIFVTREGITHCSLFATIFIINLIALLSKEIGLKSATVIGTTFFSINSILG
jgi:hypothetical protein